MYVHGMWTDGKRWPDDPGAALKWMRENGYAQYTQTTVSRDGVHFEARPGITLRTSYLRVFQWNGVDYGMARLGVPPAEIARLTDDPALLDYQLLYCRFCADVRSSPERCLQHSPL